MRRGSRLVIFLAVMVWCLLGGVGTELAVAKQAQEAKQAKQAKETKETKKEEPPATGVTIPEDVSEAIEKEATKMKAQFAAQARNVFRRDPLGFDSQTLERGRRWLFDLPGQVPDLVQSFLDHMRLLGIVGSLLLFAFLGIVFYSLFGWKKVFGHLEKSAQPLEKYITEAYFPYLLAVLRIIAATLIPLVLYVLFVLVQAFTTYKAPWFLLTGELLKLWALGALIIGTLREVLLSGILPLPPQNAATVYRVSKWVTLYVLLTIGLFLGAKLFQVPKDILALLRFVISISIVFASLLLLLKKESILGLLPELPYRTYQVVVNGLRRLYYPALFLTFLTGIAWCFGYKNFALFLWKKTWAVVGAFLVIIIVFHNIRILLQNWVQKKEPTDHQAILLHKSLHHLLIFLTITITAALILELLGLLHPIRSFISFPLIIIGAKPISLWTIIRVIILFIGIVYASRLMRSYLDYMIYPLLGIDEGLAYSINTLVSYLLIIIGIFIALALVGIDIRTLMVFAGAIGIGIGLGLQKIASNLISGFIIIFGRKVRKGDWIKVGDALGYVERVTLGSTVVWTRDNIEYIIPNTDLIAGTITNYSLSSPEIRVHVPVGVSYNADPRDVKRILLEAAESNKHTIKKRKTKVWFTDYGDNSINFELLVWVDVRKISGKEIKSQLYFTIFTALAQAGIEIPFPQRDLHLKSGFFPPDQAEAEEKPKP